MTHTVCRVVSIEPDDLPKSTSRYIRVGDTIDAWNRRKRPWRGMRNKVRARIKANKKRRRDQRIMRYWMKRPPPPGYQGVVGTFIIPSTVALPPDRRIAVMMADCITPGEYIRELYSDDLVRMDEALKQLASDKELKRGFYREEDKK
jgi:hypothetical protein